MSKSRLVGAGRSYACESTRADQSYETKTTAKKVAGLLKTIKKAKGLTYPKIAEQAGISVTLLDGLLYLDTLSASTLKKLKAWAVKI
jgi:LysM repeat protein